MDGYRIRACALSAGCRHHQHQNSLWGVWYQAEFANDLVDSDWSSSETVVVLDTPELLTVRDAIPVRLLQQRYARLRVPGYVLNFRILSDNMAAWIFSTHVVISSGVEISAPSNKTETPRLRSG